MLAGQQTCNGRRIHTGCGQFKDTAHDGCCLRVNNQRLLVSRQPHETERNRATAAQALCHTGFEDRCDLASGIFGIPVIHQVDERRELVLCRIIAVDAVVDGDEPDAFFRKCYFGVEADFQIVSAKSAHVLDDHSTDQASLNITHHLGECRSIKVRTGVAVVRVMPDVCEAILSCIVFQVLFLIENGVAFSS